MKYKILIGIATVILALATWQMFALYQRVEILEQATGEIVQFLNQAIANANEQAN